MLAQVSGTRFDKFPKHNNMVDKCVLAIRYINHGNIDSLNMLNSKNHNDFDSLNLHLKNMMQGIPYDTSMIEFYDFQSKTEISYRVKDMNPNKQILYCVTFSSDGIDGSTKNFSMRFYIDDKSLKLKQLIEDLPPPKTK